MVRQVTDQASGGVEIVAILRGPTRQSVCSPCATKARRLPMHQCREGRHRQDEPDSPVSDSGPDDDPAPADVEDPVDAEAAYARHIDRLAAEVRWLPCGPSCANRLRFGVESKDPGPGPVPGRRPGPAHDRENLGVGGRRALVSMGGPSTRVVQPFLLCERE